MKHLMRIVPALLCAALLLPTSAEAAKRKAVRAER